MKGGQLIILLAMFLVAAAIFIAGMRAIQVPPVEQPSPAPIEAPEPLSPDTPGLLRT